jgi:hypothetical protein
MALTNDPIAEALQETRPFVDVETPYKQLGIASSGYVARDQFSLFHSRASRWSCLVCHRRAGKTVACVNELVARATYTQKSNARYAYIAPFYRQAKDVAWQYLKEATADFATAVRESELRIVLPNGAWITLYGADNIDALRGIYLDGVILDEYGDCRPGLWGEVILPTLADRRGWAVFIGTPKGNNHFKHQYDRAVKEGWYVMNLKASASGIIRPSELEEMRKQMSDEEWEQEMECSFQAALRGAYYGDQLSEMESAGRFAQFSLYNPDFKVNVASDLGFTDSTALWFWQVTSDGIAIIDYEEHHTKKLQWYHEELLSQKPYKYETVWLPHDARAKTLQTGRSTVEQMKEWGYPVKIAPKLDLQDGINAVRRVLPLCTFSYADCYDGIEALKAYRRKWDDINRCFSKDPRHDWSSHGSDAFRYFALVTQKPLQDVPKPPKLPEIELTTWQDVPLDDLFKANEKPTLRLAGRRRI